MKKATLLFSSIIVILIPSMCRASLESLTPFDLVWDQDVKSLVAGSGFELEVDIRIPEGYYLYADETDIDFTSLEGVHITDIRYPDPVRFEDPYLGKTVDIYDKDVAIVIKGKVPAGLETGIHDLIANVRFRGCSPKLCFRPEEREVAFRLDIRGVPKTAGDRYESIRDRVRGRWETADEDFGWFKELLRTNDLANLLDRGWGVTVLIVFLAGLLTSLTPCVWPVIPVVLVFVGVHPHRRFVENLLLASTLVAGMVMVYAVLGIGAAAFGKNLGFLFQSKVFLALVVMFFVVLSLAMFGAFDLSLPRRIVAKLHKLGGEGYKGAFLAGIGTGLVASPCSGPVLAAILGYAALQGNYALGFVMLIVYGLGMGLLFVILGAGYGELAGKLKGGPWLVWVKRTLGVVLLFPAAFYMGSLFGWSLGSPVGTSGSPRIEWIQNESDALKFARAAKRPVMVEFTASWCPPCLKLERDFFSKQDIVALSYRLIPLKVDATVETKAVRNAVEKYGVVGWPSVIFLDSGGKEYEDLRVNDFDPDMIEKGMVEAIERAGK